MRILLLSHTFNSLAQRLFVELREDGHLVSVELDINDRVTEEAVALFQPDVVLAPFLKRALPASVWRRVPCLVVHPGPPGDRGPAALDHAVLEGQRTWGVTVLQATGDFDAGPVRAWQACTLRAGATKASLYRHEVVHAAVQAVRAALACARIEYGEVHFDAPAPGAAPAPAARGWRPAIRAEQRTVDWACHDADEVLRRVRSADGAPGAAGQLFGVKCRLFDVHAASATVNQEAQGARPGQVLARRGPAVLVRCARGAVWIGHVRRTEPGGKPQLKLPAIEAFADEAARLPEWPTPLHRQGRGGDEWDELRYSEFGPPRATVGCLAFDFHNGALSERQAARLLQALRAARARDTRVLLLCGGADFFCNGIHLHSIEAAAARPDDGAADASLRAIEAIDDVALEILTLTDRLTVSALRGNAGAGGCFLALAADRVWAHVGVLLNPHYRNMGNLYGSEYWTYVLPQRVGAPQAQALMDRRLPMGALEAQRLGLIDECLGACADDFEPLLLQAALALAVSDAWSSLVRAKQAQRAADESRRPLAAYRADELEHMRRNFYGFDPSYHVARHHFVYRKPHAWTPRHLALHRQAKPP